MIGIEKRVSLQGQNTEEQNQDGRKKIERKKTAEGQGILVIIAILFEKEFV